MSISTFPKIITHSEYSRQSFERFKECNPPEYLQHWSERIDTDFLLNIESEVFLREDTDLTFLVNSFILFDDSLIRFLKNMTYFGCKVIFTEPFYSPSPHMELIRENVINVCKYGGVPLIKEYYIHVEDSPSESDTYFFDYILKQHNLNISNTYYITVSGIKKDNNLLEGTGVTILERQIEKNNLIILKVSDKYIKFEEFDALTDILILAEKMSLARLEKYKHE